MFMSDLVSGFFLEASSGVDDGLPSSSVEVLHLQPVLQVLRELRDEDVLLGMLSRELSNICHL